MNVMNDPYSVRFWALWAIILVWQNYAFTFVSRARNSGSLRRHLVAAVQSNGVWFLQFLFAVNVFNKIIAGTYGWKLSVVAVLYYTVFTMAGSLYAHYRSLRKEKGLGAVGANRRYAQITVEEWARVQDTMRMVTGPSTKVPFTWRPPPDTV